MSWLAPVTLQGAKSALIPLSVEHLPGLQQATGDGELWRLWYTAVPSPEGMAAEIERRLALPTMCPFTVFDAGGRVVGMTTYMNTDALHKRVEIGSTWYARSVQRSHVNTTAKLLMMGHAFDTLDCQVVGWRTDNYNFASQRAIERLGARKDGVIRGHALRRDGTIRDTVMYSMRSGEWPEARAQLLYLLQRHAQD